MESPSNSRKAQRQTQLVLFSWLLATMCALADGRRESPLAMPGGRIEEDTANSDVMHNYVPGEEWGSEGEQNGTRGGGGDTIERVEGCQCLSVCAGCACGIR